MKKATAVQPAFGALSEYMLTDLVAEIERRHQAVIHFLCPYCYEDIRTHSCKFAERLADYHPRADKLEKRLRRARGSLQRN